MKKGEKKLAVPWELRSHRDAKIFRVDQVWRKARQAVGMDTSTKFVRHTEAELIAAKLYALAHMDRLRTHWLHYDDGE